MGTITPILDTLLSSVAGRAGDTARVGEKAGQRSVAAVRGGRESVLFLEENKTPPKQVGPRSDVEGSRAVASARPQPRSTGNPLRGTNPAQAGRESTGAANSTRLHLSRGAQTLARLLADIEPGKSMAVTTSRPLLPTSAPPSVTQLASVLANQLSGSGLFYEAHLEAWVRGQWPRAKLLSEPQATLKSEPSTTSPNTSGLPNASAQTLSTIDPRVASIVSQQAELLASGVFTWTGYAWQGVPMRWSVERHAEDAEEAPVAEPTRAQTSISLDLPALGALEARLTLGDGAINVSAWIAPGEGRTRLDEALGDLRQRLRRAGFSKASTHLISDAPDA